MIVLHLTRPPTKADRRFGYGCTHHKYILPPPGSIGKKHLTINGVRWTNHGTERAQIIKHHA